MNCTSLCAFISEQRLCARLPRGGQPDRSGHAGDVRAGHEVPAAHAGQVPLHLQPARLLQGHPGRLPHQEGRCHGQENYDKVMKQLIDWLWLFLRPVEHRVRCVIGAKDREY